MDAHVGSLEEPFVVEMTADGVEWFFRFVIIGTLVGIMFLPMFAYGLGVSACDFVKVRYPRVREYVTELSTKSRYETHASKANS